MTNRDLEEKLGTLIRNERRITNEILQLINLGLKRRAYVELGFSSMFDWLTKGFGYSNAAAYRRIQSAKLLKEMPILSEKLQEGTVNLSNVSKAQSIFANHEKLTGQKISAEMRNEAIRRIESKSTLEAERELVSLFPEAAASAPREIRTVIDANTTRHTFNLSTEAEANLKRAKEVLSHRFPDPSDAAIFAYALEFLLQHKDPHQKSTSASEAVRVTKAGTRRSILNLAKASCTFKDPVTGRICGSQFQIQIDHILPKALGVSDEPSNLRPLCRQHNLYYAEQAFGPSALSPYRRPN